MDLALPKDKKVLMIGLVGGGGLALLMLLSKGKSSPKAQQVAAPFGPAWWPGIWNGGGQGGSGTTPPISPIGSGGGGPGLQAPPRLGLEPPTLFNPPPGGLPPAKEDQAPHIPPPPAWDLPSNITIPPGPAGSIRAGNDQEYLRAVVQTQLTSKVG